MMSSHKIEHYILGQTIGIGGSAKVKVAQHEFTGNKVAIKIMNKSKMREMRVGSRVKREISMLRYFNHPNIIKMYEVLETQNDIFLITEYAPQGDLTRLICKSQKLTEKDVKFFFRQIIAAVEYCHSNLVAHRDLKPENILLDEHNTIKLADFGLANLMKDGKFMKTDCGSPNYVAPEVISRNRRYCGSEADTWSCGVILYTLLAGSLPFDETSIQSLFKKIVKGKFHIPAHFSKEVTDLIHKMLNPDPTKRVKLYEIKYHEWMRHTEMMYLDPREIRPYKDELLRIKNDVLEKVKDMQFNFGGLSEQKIKEVIERRKECSFAIGFNILYDEVVKKDVTSKLVKTQQGKTCEKLADLNSNKDICKKKMLESCKTVSTVPETADSLFTKDSATLVMDDSGIFGSVVNGALKASPTVEHKKSEQESHLETESWHYGLKFSLSPQEIMEGITSTLAELNTISFKQSSPYKMKCYYHIHKEFAISRPNSFGLKALDNHMPRNNSMCEYPGQPLVKDDKYSKDEIAFKIQIYGLPNKRDHIVDIQRIKGHAIIFLDYCQKFVQVLERKLV